jgi:cell division septation protein DedD
VINRLKPDKRFYFQRHQLVVLAFAFALAAIIIFFLGGLTGKTIAHRRLAERAALVVKIPLNPPTPELDSGPEAGPREGAASEPASTKEVGEKASAKEPAPEAKPEPRPAKTETARPAPPVKEPARTPDVAEIKSAEKSAPAPTVREESKASQTVQTESAYPMWTVQVRSSSDKKFAESWVDRLRGKGYDAFIVEADVKGQTWYRVRVGLLAAREEAEAMQNMLASKEALSETFVLQAVR